MRNAFLLLLALALTGCGNDRAAKASPAAHVDTILPFDDALALFRANLPEVTDLQGGTTSLGALIDTFLVRLARRDTVGLIALTMTRAEFGWLYYPTVPEARPPYDLAPDLMWFMVEGNGGRGLGALLDAFADAPPRVAGWRCEETRMYGSNRVYSPCVFDRLQGRGDTVTDRLFGPIVEREGHFKFVSYSNQL